MPPKQSAKPAAKGPSKPAGLSALKAQMQKRKEAEEQRKKEEEQERLRIEEEMRKIEEEERRREEEKKVEKESKVSTMTQKQRQEQIKKLESLRHGGLIVPDVVEESDNTKSFRKNLYASKKTSAKKKISSPETQTESAPTEPVYVAAALSSDDASSVCSNEFGQKDFKIDSWEDLVADPFVEEQEALMSTESNTREVVSSLEATERKLLMKSFELERRKAVAAENTGKLRSPICCVLGHVDAGKTSFLDKLRRTNLQGAEAGGITQQIGSTFFPLETIVEKTKEIAETNRFNVKIPGLLIIDTPGHESFTNLRSRGSSLCDIAIVIVDITKGIEPQTRESFHLLRQRKCSFVVAMNKVDRIYGWRPFPDRPIQYALKHQEGYVIQEYNTRVAHVVQQLMEEGFNSKLYYENKDFQKNVSLVPVSAHTGEGTPDLLVLLVQLMQKFLSARVSTTDDFRCSILEVKKMEGQGTTLDVILVNGSLRVGDTIVVCGFAGPIVTNIRALITPQVCRELRAKGDLVFHEEVHAACGVKIAAHDLEDAVAGSPLILLPDASDENAKKSAMAEVMKDLDALKQNLQLKGIGICVQASTMGSLEALLSFLRENKVDVAHVAIGPMHKRHVLNAILIKEKAPEKASILAFDVPITREAQEIADANDIPIFCGDVIYRLLEEFQKYGEKQKEKRKEANSKVAVFPATFKVVKTFRSTEPIILGVEVLRGQLRPNSPCFTMKNNEPQLVGTIIGIEHENSQVSKAVPEQTVAIKIQAADPQLCIGRHVQTTGLFHTHMTRHSIDALKESFRDEMETDDWRLVIELKRLLSIM